ncbi:MAG: FtsW/RodA/SpoVE family cell cycle protein, partial [Myxococcota bacterium]
PVTMPAMNTTAIAIGVAVLMIAGPLVARPLRAHGREVGIAVVVLLALTFVSEPTSDVHRWISVGRMRLHPSSMLAPIALLSLRSLLADDRFAEAAIVFVALQVIHIGQPDAGQATAVAAGAIAAMLCTQLPRLHLRTGVGVALGTVLLAWSRPDPLQPVALVEDMPARAFELGIPYGVAAALGLLALPAAALLRRRAQQSSSETVAAVTLAVYFATTIAVTFVGHFPTPVLGFGASPIIGAVVGLGLLHGFGAPRSPPAE